MKSLFKIIRRYSLTAGLIIFVVLFCNGFVLLYWGYQNSKGELHNTNVRGKMETIGENLRKKEGGYQLSKEGKEVLGESGFLWAMALNPEGEIVWEWKLPSEIPRSYTLQEVASFSRWYLKNYPVRVWQYDDLLFVFGNNPKKEIKYNAIFSLKVLENIPLYLKTALIANLIIISLFIFCLGYRFYGALSPVAEGIEQLSKQETLHLKEKGMAKELVEKINLTSGILESQKQKLEQRDKARTEWISGVSHDIRTPLAFIVGYSDRLMEDEALGEEERKLAESIRRQSMVISQLVQDLNLTSKLAYQVQPLRKTECAPAFLLRECIADFYNEDLNQNFEIHLLVSPEAEQMRIHVDGDLIKRALRNLIGNSIRHNPKGCYVEVSLSKEKERMECTVKDNGVGISEKIVKNMDKDDSEVHIMGLRLTRQIARAHGGELYFLPRENGAYDVKFVC